MIPAILCLSALTQFINECPALNHPRDKGNYWIASCSPTNDMIKWSSDNDSIIGYRELAPLYPNREILCDITDGDKEELLFIDRAPR